MILSCEAQLTSIAVLVLPFCGGCFAEKRKLIRHRYNKTGPSKGVDGLGLASVVNRRLTTTERSRIPSGSRDWYG